MVDERELIRRARRNDQRAFELLVGLKREKALRIALNIVGDEDDAKDIAQTAFIKLWSALHQFDENSRFDPWFYKIVVNLAIDFYRKRQRSPREVPLPGRGAAAGGRDEEGASGALPAEALPGADVQMMQAELRRIFNEMAAELAPAQRAVFTLREIEGVATEEIAKILDIKASTVRNHLMTARRTLQEGLKRRYPEYLKGLKK